MRCGRCMKPFMSLYLSPAIFLRIDFVIKCCFLSMFFFFFLLGNDSPSLFFYWNWEFEFINCSSHMQITDTVGCLNCLSNITCLSDLGHIYCIFIYSSDNHRGHILMWLQSEPLLSDIRVKLLNSAGSSLLWCSFQKSKRKCFKCIRCF